MANGDDLKIGGKLNLPMQASFSNANTRADMLAKRFAEQGPEGKLISTKAVKDTPEDVKKAATQFEALLLHQMLGAMWETVPKGGLVSGSNEEAMYRDMLNEGIANEIAEHQSIGIRDVIAKDINNIEHKNQKK